METLLRLFSMLGKGQFPHCKMIIATGPLSLPTKQSGPGLLKTCGSAGGVGPVGGALSGSQVTALFCLHLRTRSDSCELGRWNPGFGEGQCGHRSLREELTEGEEGLNACPFIKSHPTIHPRTDCRLSEKQASKGRAGPSVARDL